MLQIYMRSPIAQSVEHVAVNHRVGGSSPSRGAIFYISIFFGTMGDAVNFPYMVGHMVINAPGYILYAMGILLFVSLWKKTLPRKTLLGLWALLFTIYCSPLPVSMIHHMEQQGKAMAPSELPQDFEGFVLLGGCFSLQHTKINSERPIYNPAGSRMFDFILLAKDWPHKRIVLTGTALEAELMKNELIKFGIEASRITVENAARNTEDNATKTFDLIQPKGKWVLVTSAFHMKRAIMLFEKAGWSVIPWPVGFVTGEASGSSWWPYPGNGWAWYAGAKELIGFWHHSIVGGKI